MRDRTLAALALTSLVLSLWVPLTTNSPEGDLGGYTDHRRHVAVVQLALRHGVDVYLRPFGALLTETPVVHAQRDWVDIGYVYPPGALLVFAPLVPLARAGLPDSVFVRLCLAWVLLLTHLAIYACWSALAKSPPHWR